MVTYSDQFGDIYVLCLFMTLFNRQVTFLNRQQFSYTLAEAEEHKLKSEKVIESLQQEIQELQSKLNNATNSSPEEVCFLY